MSPASQAFCFSNTLPEVPHLFVGKANRGVGGMESPPINLLSPWADDLISLGLSFLICKTSKMDYSFTYLHYSLPAFYFESEKSD